MTYTVVVEKVEARIVFICDAQQPLLLDALWPPVGYNFVLWYDGFAPEVLKTPWNYVFQDGKPLAKSYAFAANASENARRGQLLLQLARATNRHRRGVLKEDVLGQADVYRFKADEAVRFLSSPQQAVNVNSFPWLRDAAAFDNLTLADAANQILFRHTQMQQVLQYTENTRRQFTKRILTAPLNELAQVQAELSTYERRG